MPTALVALRYLACVAGIVGQTACGDERAPTEAVTPAGIRVVTERTSHLSGIGSSRVGHVRRSNAFTER